MNPMNASSEHQKSQTVDENCKCNARFSFSDLGSKEKTLGSNITKPQWTIENNIESGST